jgi:radical SAM protein with 4Fe4S-binding SPASM domain
MGYSPFRHIGSIFWKGFPVHFTFFVTKRCNQRCSFCFYLSSDIKKDIKELDLGEIEKISSSMKKLLWLAFSGGEIFLRNDIVEITKIFYENNKPAIILFPTNGLLTSIIYEKIEAILRHCRKSTIVVKLSIDGTEYLHDSLRGLKGSFQKTLETYNVLGELLERYSNFELGINTVFCSANQDNMDELIELVNSMEKIRTHTISLIRGEVSDERLKDIHLERYLETIKKLETALREKRSPIYYFKGARIKAAQDILQRRLIYETLLQKRRLIPCYAGRLNLVLTESGDLYPCESFTMKTGNVRDNEYDIRKTLKTTQAQKVLHFIKNNGCYCTHECYFMTNILFNPFMYPRLFKEYLKLRT